MLEGVETPNTLIPFLITINNACKSIYLDLLGVSLLNIKRNFLFSLPKLQYE